MIGSDEGCNFCRPQLETLSRQTYKEWHRRQAEAEGLLNYEQFCAAIGRVDSGLADLLRQRPCADLLAVALHQTEE